MSTRNLIRSLILAIWGRLPYRVRNSRLGVRMEYMRACRIIETRSYAWFPLCDLRTFTNFYAPTATARAKGRWATKSEQDEDQHRFERALSAGLLRKQLLEVKPQTERQ